MKNLFMEENKHDENEDQFEKDEDYGLPDVSYEPVNREDITMNPREQPSQKHKDESSWPLIIGIVIVLILAGVLVYFFFIKKDEPVVQTSPPVVEEIPEPEEFIVEEDHNWDTPVEEPAIVEPMVGVMTDVNARTGRAYIVVSSFIDVDLAHDYGNKLAGEGVSTVVIAPYGNVKYYRLSVADFPTVGDALAKVDQYKAKYGDNIWVLKY
jgi:hypothetical protein